MVQWGEHLIRADFVIEHAKGVVRVALPRMGQLIPFDALFKAVVGQVVVVVRLLADATRVVDLLVLDQVLELALGELRSGVVGPTRLHDIPIAHV